MNNRETAIIAGIKPSQVIAISGHGRFPNALQSIHDLVVDLVKDPNRTVVDLVKDPLTRPPMLLS